MEGEQVAINAMNNNTKIQEMVAGKLNLVMGGTADQQLSIASMQRSKSKKYNNER